VLLSLVALSAISFPYAVSQFARRPSLLKRVIDVKEYGLVSYNDTFMLSRYDLETSGNASSFVFTIPEAYARYVIRLPKPFTFSAGGSEITDTFVVSEASGAIEITVARASLINMAVGDYANFSISYRLLLKPEQIARQLKNLTLPLKFDTTLPAHYFSANITIPKSTFWAIPSYFEKQDMDSLTVFYDPYFLETSQKFELIYIILSSQIFSLTVSSMYKTITLDPLSGLTVEDGFSLRSDPISPSGVIPPVYITKQAFDVAARDLIGPISFQVTDVPNSTVVMVSVEPRISLRSGGNYTFFISYKLPASNFTNREGDRIIITAPQFRNYTLYVHSYSISVNMPIGAKIESIQMAGTNLTAVEHLSSNVARVSLSSLPFDILSKGLVITANYPILWAGYTPSALVFIVGTVALGAYYTVLRRPARPEKVEAEPAVKLASEATRSIRRSLAIFAQIQELEAQYFEGDINRKEFRGLHHKLRSDLERALSEVRDLSRRLPGASAFYASKMKTYESLWAELQAKQASRREVGFGYLNKKISRAAFAELSERYSKEISDTVYKLRSLLDEFPSS